MELVGTTEFSNIAKVSRQAIAIAIKRKRLINLGKGRRTQIDLDCRYAKRYLSELRAKRAGPEISKKEKAEIKEKKVKERSAYVEKLKEKVEEELKNPTVDGSNANTKHNLEKEKIKSTTRKTKIEIAQKMEILIHRDQVDKVFGNLYSIILNYFFPIGDRLSNSIAGVFGVKDVTRLVEVKDMIDKEIMRGLSQFKKECEKLSKVEE